MDHVITCDLEQYRDVREITGTVLIKSCGDALKSLDALSNLVRVGGNLNIQLNDALTSLSGLANLESVGGFLYLRDLHLLTTLNGLSKLNTIDDYLYIGYNYRLRDLSGLSNVASVQGSFIEVCFNTAITSIPSFLRDLSRGKSHSRQCLFIGNGCCT